jgi:hypothetical protein
MDVWEENLACEKDSLLTVEVCEPEAKKLGGKLPHTVLDTVETEKLVTERPRETKEKDLDELSADEEAEDISCETL